MQSPSKTNRPSTLLSGLYLGFFLLGTAIPMYFFVQHFLSQGFSFSLFLAQAFVNPVASALTNDLLISSFVFWLFAGVQLKAKGQLNRLVVFIVLNLLIGLSCALPAYFWWSMRQQKA